MNKLQPGTPVEGQGNHKGSPATSPGPSRYRRIACQALLLVLFCAAVAAGVFVLPWHVPHPQRVASNSYTYGFNNLVADVWIALMLAILLGYGLLSRQNSPFLNSLWSLLPDQELVCRDKRLFRAFLGVLAFSLAILVGFFAFLPYAYYGELWSEVLHLELMAMGLRPYTDFAFFYGPGMLYPAHLLYVWSGRLLSIEQSSLAALLAHWAIGLYLLYYILSRLRGEFARAAVFCLIALGFFNFSLGIEYTPLRFVLPIASVIFVHRLVLRVADGNSRSMAKAIAAAFLVPLVSFSVSPEVGVATWLACLAYFTHLWRTLLRRLALLCIIPAVASLPAMAIAFSPDYLRVLTSFSAGGANFPIFPTPAIICLLIAAFWVLPALAKAGLRSREPSGSAALALCVAAGLLIPAALGRCDPIHVSFNGAGILLLFLAALSQSRSWLYPWAVTAYVGVYLTIGQVSLWKFYSIQNHQVLAVRAFLASAPSSLRQPPAPKRGLHYSKVLPDFPGYQALSAFEKIGVPLGGSEWMQRFLRLNGKYVPEYYVLPLGMEIFTKAQLERKISDLRSMPLILVPVRYLQRLRPSDLDALARRDSETLAGLLVFPVNLKPRNTPFLPPFEVISEIQSNYVLVASVFDHVVLERKPGTLLK